MSLFFSEKTLSRLVEIAINDKDESRVIVSKNFLLKNYIALY